MSRLPAAVARSGARSAALILGYWLAAVRPKTLSLAVIPVLVGSALAQAEGVSMRWGVAVAAALAAILIQAGTNLHNDAADFLRGADDRRTRVGPPRATCEGWLTPTQVRRAAAAAFAVAAALGFYLVQVGGWPILVLGLFSVLAGLAYSAGPRPIGYSASGELFVWLFFGVVAVGGSYYLQAGVVSAGALLAGSMIGMPAAAVLVVNNYRDLENDRRVGKNTLAVRLGRGASRLEYALLVLAPFPLLFALGFLAPPGPGVWLAFLALPWGLLLVRRLQREPPGPGLNAVLASTARFQLGFGLLLSVGSLSAPWWQVA